MAQLTITIPNDKVQRVLDAFDYTPDMGDKATFMKREIINMIKSKVVMVEIQRQTPVAPHPVTADDLTLT